MISISEKNGIEALTPLDLKIYSVGISTGGAAEMQMAQLLPARHIIATTIDHEGAEFARREIAKEGLTKQIDVKIEDVAKPLPYPDEYFDVIYARLVLHYLPKMELQRALKELYRVLKRGGKIFVVVRSVESDEAKSKNATFDETTGLTIYYSNGNSYSRYFHTEESIQGYLKDARFLVENVSSYNEKLCVDFKRMIPSEHVDTLIEVLAIRI